MKISPLFLFAAAWVLSRMASPAGKATQPKSPTNPGGWPNDGSKLTKAQIVALATNRGFTDPSLAAAIAMAESGGNPSAHALTPKEDSWGLWQINLKAHPQYDSRSLQDVGVNADAAYQISAGGKSWKPWGAYTNGSYKQYLLFQCKVLTQVRRVYTVRI